MNQNNIEAILANHKIVPVVTINNEAEIEGIIATLQAADIHCIEVTLRTAYAFDALAYIKKHYSDQITVGVGTVVTKEQVEKVKEIGVDFIVSPGINADLGRVLMDSEIAFIPGVATPSDIILGMQFGWETFKFFPC